MNPWTPTLTFYFSLVNLWRKYWTYVLRIIIIIILVICHDRNSSFIKFRPSQRDTENTMSDLYFNKKIDYSEEKVWIKNSTPPFFNVWTISIWVWTEKNVLDRYENGMRARRKNLQKLAFAYILQNRCSKKPYQKETSTQVFFCEISKTSENIFFYRTFQSLLLKLNIFILQLLIYYILE